MGQAGISDFEVSAWFGVYAPAKTPAAIIQRLNGEIARMIGSPALKESLIGQGIDPIYGTPEDLAALIKSGIARWAKAVEISGARLSN